MLSATPGGCPWGVRGFMSGAYSLTPGPLPLVNSTPGTPRARCSFLFSASPSVPENSLLPPGLVRLGVER